MGSDPWMNYHDHLTKGLAHITGAQREEIAVMNSLTVNLHLLLATFYRPNKKRYKILCEANAFPSDQYMLETHVKHHRRDPDATIMEVHPRGGENFIREEDIEQAIEMHGDELAVVLWGGVNYFSGQVFDIRRITAAAHKAGAVAGFDLAHAAGNVQLKLHEWNVDFACWCSYKYLNGGPGGIGCAYVHERYHDNETLPRLGGWWGNDSNTRFEMKKGFVPAPTAEGWQVSTPPIMLMAALRASLDLFMEAGIDKLAEKGKEYSDYLIDLIDDINASREKIRVLTPRRAKGCQLSLRIISNPRGVFEELRNHGIFADWREPNVIRVAPVPLYNTKEEIATFAEVLKKLTHEPT
jgi:kynureninase